MYDILLLRVEESPKTKGETTMNYCMKYATKGDLTLALDRCGRNYKVTVYDKCAHAITFSEDFSYDEFELAEKLFNEYGKANGFSEPSETNVDFFNID